MKKQLLLAFAAGFLAVTVNGQVVLRNTTPVQNNKSTPTFRLSPVAEIPGITSGPLARPSKGVQKNTPSP